MDVICPKTGEILVPARRTLTKKYVMKAEESGVKITHDMLYDPHANRKTDNEKVALLKKRIARLKDQISRRQSELESLLANKPAEARKKSEAVNRKSKEYTMIIERILGGETVTAVAKSLGVTPPSVQRKLRMGCRRTNAELYDAGIKPDETNNYRTPPLDYLRKHRAIFLPNNGGGATP